MASGDLNIDLTKKFCYESYRSLKELSNALYRLSLRFGIFLDLTGVQKVPRVWFRTFQSPPGIGLRLFTNPENAYMMYSTSKWIGHLRVSSMCKRNYVSLCKTSIYASYLSFSWLRHVVELCYHNLSPILLLDSQKSRRVQHNRWARGKWAEFYRGVVLSCDSRAANRHLAVRSAP